MCSFSHKSALVLAERTTRSKSWTNSGVWAFLYNYAYIFKYMFKLWWTFLVRSIWQELKGCNTTEQHLHWVRNSNKRWSYSRVRQREREIKKNLWGMSFTFVRQRKVASWPFSSLLRREKKAVREGKVFIREDKRTVMDGDESKEKKSERDAWDRVTPGE